MKQVVLEFPKPLRAGDRVHTEGWSVSSDTGEFTVVEILHDGWVRCIDDKGQLRMFDRINVRRVDR